jgi:hypothetical protein
VRTENPAESRAICFGFGQSRATRSQATEKTPVSRSHRSDGNAYRVAPAAREKLSEPLIDAD